MLSIATQFMELDEHGKLNMPIIEWHIFLICEKCLPENRVARNLGEKGRKAVFSKACKHVWK